MSDATQTQADCCREFSLSRRSLLGGATALGGTMALTRMLGDSMLQASFASAPGGNTLVVISLRGGIDGLGAVVPHGDPGYYAARPTTAVAANQLVCADAMFGLHPALAPLAPYWQSGELAAVQAVGLPVVNRSHFAAIEEVEDAAPGSDSRAGWINRMVGLGASTSAPTDLIQLGQNFPTTAVHGDHPSLAALDLDSLEIAGADDAPTQRYGSLETMWGGARGPMARAAAEAIDISRGAGARLAALADPAVTYPTVWNADPFAQPLKQAAQLIKADLGTDVIAIDAGSWDFHTGYGTTQWGSMMSALDGFGQSLAAFLADLGSLRQRVTVVTISEFGRRVAENGSRGFDHGWGNMMLVAGAGVKGGRYYSRWPGLGASALAEGDLKVTTDYRDVLAEVVARRFPARSVAETFPGLTPDPLGFMAA